MCDTDATYVVAINTLTRTIGSLECCRVTYLPSDYATTHMLVFHAKCTERCRVAATTGRGLPTTGSYSRIIDLHEIPGTLLAAVGHVDKCHTGVRGVTATSTSWSHLTVD